MNENSPPYQTVEPRVNPQVNLLPQILSILRNRKWIVIQALVIIPAAVLLLTSRQEETYEATASLLFRDSVQALLPAQDGGPTDLARRAATNDELISLEVISERVAETLDGRVSAAQIHRSVEVEPSGETDLARITASASSPRLAATLANAYATAYIDFRRNADRAQLRDAVLLARQSFDALPPEDQAGKQGTALQGTLEQLELAQSLQTGNAELVQQASAPSEPASPNLLRNMLFALILAIVVGFALGALRERLDRRLRTVEELEATYRLPVLARIPRNRRLARSGEPVSLSRLGDGADAAFRMLRANLRYYNVDRKIRSILVASPQSGDGKTTVGRMLAMAMAAQGEDVLFVEADLHKEAEGAGGSTPTMAGLSTVLLGYTDLDDAFVSVGQPGEAFKVLPTGPLPPNPSELVDSDSMRSLLRALESRFDMVILDTPPLSIVSDALSLISLVSGVLVISGLGRTTRETAETFRKQLRLLQARPLGLVVNFSAPEKNYYYDSPTRLRLADPSSVEQVSTGAER